MSIIAKILGVTAGIAAIAAGGGSIALLSTWLLQDDTALIQSMYERVRDRAERESVARVRFPELTAEDVAVIDDEFLKVAPFVAEPQPSPIPREPSAHWGTPKLAGAADADPTYLGFNGKAVPVDDSLPKPPIDVSWEGSQPIFTMPKQFRAGVEAVYYWEIDTTPAFNSPNFWRAPALVPAYATLPEDSRQDLTARTGLPFSLFQTQRRDDDGSSNVLRFPFRASAMRLPSDWLALDFEAMSKQSRALTHGLTEQEAIAEVFRYVRQVYPWAMDTKQRTPLDTFRAGLGECGRVNDLMGAFLELSRIRYRGISGFNPSVRVLNKYEGSGHFAIEAYDSRTGRWSYVDPYLDIFTPGVSAKDIANGHPAGSSPVFSIYKESRSEAVPGVVTAKELFKLRIYNDKRRRLPIATMFEVQGDEASYGSQWELDEAPTYSPEELFSGEVTIYVRGRYLFSGGVAARHPSEPLPPDVSIKAKDLRLSPWSTVQVKVEPRQVVAAGVQQQGKMSTSSRVSTN